MDMKKFNQIYKKIIKENIIDDENQEKNQFQLDCDWLISQGFQEKGDPKYEGFAVRFQKKINDFFTICIDMTPVDNNIASYIVGCLYLNINDVWDEVQDNIRSGTYQIYETKAYTGKPEKAVKRCLFIFDDYKNKFFA